ncbi:MAG TPA: hypothetical protein VM554_04020 [Acidisarcina sp.]|nr:hypothetical protein [Acidisarcina sp.]
MACLVALLWAVFSVARHIRRHDNEHKGNQTVTSDTGNLPSQGNAEIASSANRPEGE